MWRNFKFLQICHVEEFEITQHVENFQISPHLSCKGIWYFSMWQIFLHISHRWYRLQIWGMSTNLLLQVYNSHVLFPTMIWNISSCANTWLKLIQLDFQMCAIQTLDRYSLMLVYLQVVITSSKTTAERLQLITVSPPLIGE